MKALLSLIILAAILAIVSIEVIMNARSKRLEGVLIDLELAGPDPRRHSALQEALKNKVTSEGDAKGVTVSLCYLHFVQVSEADLNSQHVDFILLSPQSTPWHVYEREFPTEMDRFKGLLVRAIKDYDIPVLGICGGHQFLALAFGGTVGFIDEKLEQSRPDTYPKDGLAERGDVVLETLADDPLFQGIVVHPGTFMVSESHYEEVKKIPQSFVNLARSSLSEIQILRLPYSLVYGLAFHPERGWEPCFPEQVAIAPGKKLLQNFLSMVLDVKANKNKDSQ